MNWFLEQSIDYASQRSYLDDLFKVYPTIPNGIRQIDKAKWKFVETAYNSADNHALIMSLLDLEIFPLKDSYVAFLKKDRSALARNPKTVNRLAAEIREMGLDNLYEKCSQPKETNRQIGPMFKNWVKSGALGFPTLCLEDFKNTNENAILDASDKEMEDFAREELGYIHEKGLDFLARISRQFVIGEAKFLSDTGGHQNAQFNDAIATLESYANAIKIAILDGVVYIKKGGKMYKDVTGKHSEHNIMSALLLRSFLNSI